MFLFTIIYALFFCISALAQSTVTTTDANGLTITSTIAAPPTNTAVQGNQGPVGAPPSTSGTPHLPIPYTYTTVINGVTTAIGDMFTPTDIKTTPTSIPATGSILALTDFLSMNNITVVGSSTHITPTSPLLVSFILILSVLPAFMTAGRLLLLF